MTDMPFSVFSIEADKDYLLARLVSQLGSAFNGRAGYLSHQACEKYMKAFLVQKAGAYPAIHVLGELAAACAEHDPYFATAVAKAAVEIFDRFDQVGRYGGAAKHDPLANSEPDVQTKGVMWWQANYLDTLDAFVFETHARLDYTKVGMRDQLDAVFKDEKNTFLAGTWTGPSSLREVLTHKNKRFPA